MVGSFQKFILLCDQKRGNNITFSVKDEFNNLTKEEQKLIIDSISAIDNNLYKFDSLPEVMQGLVLRNYEPGYSEDIRKSKYNNLSASSRINILTELMALQDQDVFSGSKDDPFDLMISAAEFQMLENLKITLSGIVDIDEAKTTIGFEGKFNEPAEGEVKTFVDAYAGVNVTVRNNNGTCYIDNQEIAIEQKDGYAEISYNDNFVRDKFLNELERLYFVRCAEEGFLSLDQMIDRGMILQVANSTNDKEYELEQVFKLISVFEDQSSFLHFAIKKMSMQQLNHFIENIPRHLKEQYLELSDREGRKVIDLVANEPDKVQLIRSAIRAVNNAAVILNQDQSVHTASVHKTADESLVKLAKHSIGIVHQTDNDGATIHLDHNKAKIFVNKNITSLQQRLDVMQRYNDLELFEYIKENLSETQKNLNVDSPEIIKILAFRRFQISRALNLIDDVISKGNIGDKGYKVDVNIPNSNGLTVKEMIALCYNAISQTDKLLVGNKLDENGQLVSKKYTELESIQEQEDFLKTTEFRFIEGLYGIRRGYNIDRNEDNPEEYKYTVNDDSNVCPGGTINRLAQSLSSLHEDIEVIIANSGILKLKFLNDVPRIINQIIEATPENEKQILSFQLNEWKKSNRIPNALNNKIIEKLRVELSEEGNKLMEEYVRFFTREDIIRHCAEGLMQFSYPHGKIAEVKIEVDLDNGATIEGQINSAYLDFLPKYTRDVQANYQLTIENLTQKQPELMIHLLNNDARNLKSSYVLRDGQLTPLVIDWSKNHGEMLLNYKDATNEFFINFPKLGQPLLSKFPKLMFYLLKENSSFKFVEQDTKTMIMNDWVKNNGQMLVGKKEMEQALKIVPDAFKDFFMNLSDNDFRRCVNSIFDAAIDGFGSSDILKFIPASKWHYFGNNFSSLFHKFVTNGDLEGVKVLLDSGLDPDVRIKYKNQLEPESTALYKASVSNKAQSTEIVKMLIDAGADINAAKFNGYTAISVAKSPEKLTILKEYSHNPVDYLLKSHENNPVGFISAIARVKKNGYNFEQHHSPDRFWDLDSEKITIFLNKEVARGETTNFRKIIKAGNQEMFEVALSFKPNITEKDKEMIGKFYPEFNLPNQELSKNKSWVDRITDSYIRNKSGPEINK